MIQKNLTFYKGIDYLTLGIFIKLPPITAEPEIKYDEKILKLKQILANDDRTVKIGSFKFEVNTKKSIYPYQLFLTYTPEGEKKHTISISLALHPEKSKIEAVKQGFVKTPDILIELTGRALRPQNIKQTENIIKQILQHLNAQPYAMIFSRVDYCIDLFLTDFENFVKPLIDSSKKLYKKSIIYNTDIEIDTIQEKETILGEEIIHYSRGTKGHKEIVGYTTIDRDPELLQIYQQHAEAYGLNFSKIPTSLITRIEVRNWRDSYKTINHRLQDIYTIENEINLERIIEEATNTLYDNGLPKEFIKLAETPTPILPRKNQLTKEPIPIHRKTILKQTSSLDDIIKTFIGYIKKAKYEMSSLLNENLSVNKTLTLIFRRLTDEDFRQYLKEKYKKTQEIFYKQLLNLLDKIKDTIKKHSFKQILELNLKFDDPVIPETDIFQDKFFKILDPPEDIIIEF